MVAQSTTSLTKDQQMADQCSNPSQIQDGDILDYFDGIASLNVTHHIANCLACQKEVADLQTIHSILDEVFYESDCPDEEELLAYHAGFVPRSEKKIIQQHLPDCTYCTQFVAGLTQISQRPDPLLTRIMQRGKRILTALLQPAASHPTFALLGDEEEEHIYHAGEYQIILTTIPLLPGTNLWELEGHIINLHDPEHLYKGQVSLLQDSKAITTDQLDEFGFFALDEITPGQYSLHIELSNIIIPIENFPIEIEA
jgi:hypothetical protein